MSYPNSLPASLELYRTGSQRPCSNATSTVRHSDPGWIPDTNNNADDNDNPRLRNPSRSSPRLMNFEHISQRLTPRRYNSGEGETRRRLPPFRHQNQPQPSAPAYEPPSNPNDDDFPIYDEALNFVSSSRTIWEHLRQKQKTELCTEFVKDHFTCPICRDIIINSTAISCGHKFCLVCIDGCLRTKPLCPVCGTFIRSKTSQYADDLAIESISENLSEEWKIRRQHSVIYSQMETVELTWYSTFCNWLWITNHEIKRNLRRSGRICSNAIRRWYESLTLESYVKIMVVLAALVFTACNFNEIVIFTMYMYYAMKNYEGTSPTNEHLSEIVRNYLDKKVVQEQEPPSKYQDFIGPSDTIYASFIRLFYSNWEFKFWE
ncbi:unnamed protein product [Orchesella dallaii]|uniref:RING-type domain-containing protein n=1 Tax=Orchesella dallaii TaxID=48710 RepID=A0ABP1QJ30_9HEXA